MERILNRPVLRVCSQCYNHFIRSICSTCSFCSNARSVSLFSAGRDINDRRNLSFLNSKFPIGSISSSIQGKTLSTRSSSMAEGGRNTHLLMKENKLIPRYFSLIRNIATEAPKHPNPLPPRKSKSKDSSQKSPITWKNLLIIGAVGGALLLGLQYVKKEKEEARQKSQNKKMGKASLGGDWTLVDHHGKLRSSHDFRGQWLLIYFGFTNCPDICPEEMEKIVSVLEKTDADPDLPMIQPIIITVDPTRDTPEALKEYCAEFSPRLLGFSGTEEQINVATRAYRVYYSAGPKDEDNDYIVDHSIISYLVNPDGEFAEFFGQNKKVDEIYGSAKLHILSYMKKQTK